MVARRHLLTALIELTAFLAFLLLLTVGLPLLARLNNFERDWLHQLAQAGTWVLRLTPLVLLGGMGWRWTTMRRRHALQQHRLLREGITTLVLPRPDTKPMPVPHILVWSRIAQLLPCREHLAWELTGSSLGMTFTLRATPDLTHAILTQLMAEWPGLQTRPLAGDLDPLEVGTRTGWWVEIIPKSKEAPLIAVAGDPVLAVLSEIAQLPEQVTAGLQILVRPDPFTQGQLTGQAARVTSEMQAPYQAQTWLGQPIRIGKSAEERRHEQHLDERAQRRFLEARLIVWVAAGQRQTARETAEALAQALVAQWGPANPLHIAHAGPGVPSARAFPLFSGQSWTDRELALLAHLVGGEGRAVAPHLQLAPARPLPPTPESRIPQPFYQAWALTWLAETENGPLTDEAALDKKRAKTVTRFFPWRRSDAAPC
jgi:hypothetical protein